MSEEKGEEERTRFQDADEKSRAPRAPAFYKTDYRRGKLLLVLLLRFHVEQNPVSKEKTNAFLYTLRLKSQALPLLAAMAARSAAGSTDVLCERS